VNRKPLKVEKSAVEMEDSKTKSKKSRKSNLKSVGIDPKTPSTLKGAPYKSDIIENFSYIEMFKS